MRFGVSVSVASADSTGETLARVGRIAGWRFDGVELHLHDPLDFAALRDLRRRLTELGLHATVAGVLTSSVPFERHLRELIDACAILDAQVLCGQLACAGNGRVATLAAVAAYAAEHGVTIALGGRDDSAGSAALSFAQTCRLVDAVGHANVGILFNTYQAHVAESSIGSAILSIGERMRHVQIAENDDAIPGSGQVGWSETFAALDAIHYDGWYVIDAKRDERVESIAQEGLRFLRRRRNAESSV